MFLRSRSKSIVRKSLLSIASIALAGLLVVAVASGAGDERAMAETMLKEVEASPKKDVAADLVARSKSALERGQRMRAAGDEAHAKIADSVARKWAEAARDVARAAVTEDSAGAARRDANDAGALADRERALLEEAIAQSGRLRAQMDAIEREGKDQPARTSTQANSDAGTRAPPAKPPAPVGGKDGGTK
jgi:hypothetical protein